MQKYLKFKWKNIMDCLAGRTDEKHVSVSVKIMHCAALLNAQITYLQKNVRISGLKIEDIIKVVHFCCLEIDKGWSTIATNGSSGIQNWRCCYIGMSSNGFTKDFNWFFNSHSNTECKVDKEQFFLKTLQIFMKLHFLYFAGLSGPDMQKSCYKWQQ